MYLNQQKYIKEILDRCGLIDTKYVDTFMTFGNGLGKVDDTILSDIVQYKILVGGLLYYTFT